MQVPLYCIPLLHCAGGLAAHAQTTADSKLLFGSNENGTAGLIAIIYDLKQTQAMQPSNVTQDTYQPIINQFLKQGWDESVLNRFFRITRPLYSTQIFIPRIDAGSAPKAYGVEKFVKPSSWIIHYKGQVSPPEDGTYRLVAYADDILAVAVNNKTVCIGLHPSMNFSGIWKSTEKPGAVAFNGNLTYGDWLELKKDQPIDLDILVGERPGGEFCAFLLYQKQGETYQNDPAGNPILPVFQLSDVGIPGGKLAPLATKGKPWKLFR